MRTTPTNLIGLPLRDQGSELPVQKEPRVEHLVADKLNDGRRYVGAHGNDDGRAHDCPRQCPSKRLGFGDFKVNDPSSTNEVLKVTLPVLAQGDSAREHSTY